MNCNHRDSYGSHTLIQMYGGCVRCTRCGVQFDLIDNFTNINQTIKYLTSVVETINTLDPKFHLTPEYTKITGALQDFVNLDVATKENNYYDYGYYTL